MEKKKMIMKEKAQEIAKDLSLWRRHLHQHPELSFSEHHTAEFVAGLLEKIPGMKVERNAGYPTAVVGTLSSGDGPTVAVRADMDALPIQEENTTGYSSRIKGVMHACGHDAHTAIVLGVAHLLGDSFREEELKGTIKFIFQPAEERADDTGSTGAPYMIRHGVLDGVGAVFALHMDPEYPYGCVKLHNGYSMANVDVFRAKIKGTGGHGAYPHLGTDPVWMLGNVLQAVYGITGRHVSSLDSAVISIGRVEAGSASNVIPAEVEVGGTVRTYKPEIRERTHKELQRAFSVAESLGGEAELEITAEDPALYNSPEVNRMMESAIKGLYPDFQLADEPFGMGGEDFAHMAGTVPGAMFFLGCRPDPDRVRHLHTPFFDIDENSLIAGAAILAETARQYMKGEIEHATANNTEGCLESEAQDSFRRK
ncbi:M20 metallopeptidase family protein [Virgibacillus sediminis]|uniref:M20 family metallopeptidase n=1 Tax=Virgibacillus sediminis TaxID=202260 RepID=A0ABV7A9C4_9BACI